MNKQLVWFRNDLRVRDNPALVAAMSAGPTVACFALAIDQWREHDVGDARIAFILRTLRELAGQLDTLGIPLRFLDAPRFADAPREITALAKQIGAARVLFNAEYPLNERKRDSRVILALQALGENGGESVEVDVFDGSVVRTPGTVLTATQTPYTVYSPFCKRWLGGIEAHLGLLPVPKRQTQPASSVDADTVPNRLGGVGEALFADEWPGGESAALARLDQFCASAVSDYADHRDLPIEPGTSSLSPYLSIGAISPHRCFDALGITSEADFWAAEDGSQVWARELIWREFYRHLTALFPHISQGQNFKRSMHDIPWRDDQGDFAAWCNGQTGYPLVDAAMRQLNSMGWMHNRLRMVSAMFLTKHLLIDWRWGEKYFMQQLIDGDFAANNGGWQWSASTGSDAAPYFRIFNPIMQAKKFDSQAKFIQRYVPELRGLAAKAVFEPWKVDGHDYVAPIVEHKFARQRALDAFSVG